VFHHLVNYYAASTHRCMCLKLQHKIYYSHLEYLLISYISKWDIY